VTISIAACFPTRSGFLPIFEELTDFKRLTGGVPSWWTPVGHNA
jgi:hypothetical protein